MSESQFYTVEFDCPDYHYVVWRCNSYFSTILKFHIVNYQNIDVDKSFYSKTHQFQLVKAQKKQKVKFNIMSILQCSTGKKENLNTLSP